MKLKFFRKTQKKSFKSSLKFFSFSPKEKRKFVKRNIISLVFSCIRYDVMVSNAAMLEKMAERHYVKLYPSESQTLYSVALLNIKGCHLILFFFCYDAFFYDRIFLFLFENDIFMFMSISMLFRNCVLMLYVAYNFKEKNKAKNIFCGSISIL